MSRSRSKAVVIGVELVVWTAAQSPGWAFRAPERATAAKAASPAAGRSVTPTIPTATRLGPERHISPPGGIARREAPTERLPSAPTTKEAIANAVERHLAAHLTRIGRAEIPALRRTYAAVIPGRAKRSGTAVVQFVQQQDGLDIEGSYVDCTVKLLPRWTILMSVDSRLYPSLSLPSTPRLTAATTRARAAKSLGLDPARVS